jgi:branched-chain amino acid transport system ATP-binding protein
MVALLGTNGAGKSTLLRVISGVGRPTAGTVRLAGEDITFMDTTDRLANGVCAIEGGRSSFGPLTVVENLRLLGYSHGRNKAAVERGLDATFEAFPRLAERRNQAAATLSGGEQQMLAIGRALMSNPRLLLLDEPSLGLAPLVVHTIFEAIDEIRSKGTTILLVEQNAHAALGHSDRAYVLETGRIVMEGPSKELAADPRIKEAYLGE